MSLKNVTKETAYSALKRLVERFSENYESYKNQGYNETQTRIDFINPFFKALGWDMDNEQGFAEAYREVIHEDKIKVGEAVKAPDYCFTIQGQKKLFYVEAKKPSIAIKDDIHPSYQVRRYGWSAKLPISVVTDFEELAVYDTSVKPSPKDNASVARIKYITYDKYLNQDEFDFIWDTFSKEKVLKGSFDKYIKSDAKKRGTSSVDKEFLESLDSWREELAKNITSRNAEDGFTEEHINYAVQNILDRIIFLRICEDRGVEPYGKLQKIAEEYTVYQKLVKYFLDADDRYNSGLFRFKKDKNDPKAPIDDITPKLILDDKVLKKIIKELYYPESPYQFSEIPVEILGQAYEQFLGKVIRVTKGGICKVEEKPEVRKAGGVYYTPEYVVDYIVNNTVGKLIEGKKPKDIGKIKIVDPACGSGSFLIGAYKYLLNYHLEYYTQAKKQTKEIKNALTPDGRLTTNEKKRILLNNIHGVDIDSQAVEVTKLSLLLKAMEGETDSSIKQQMVLFHERVLPTLDNNIKCGNSLVGYDFYDGALGLDNQDIMRKIKPFDWTKSFPEVFNQGGFDAVIGNPPYVNIENLDDLSKSYFFKIYESCKGRTDIYVAFLERALSFCKPEGYTSFIIPFAFTNQVYGTSLRKKIIENYHIESISDASDYYIFDTAKVKNIIIVIKNTKTKSDSKIRVFKSKEDFINKTGNEFTTNQVKFLELKDYRFETKPVSELLKIKETLWNNSIEFGKICFVAYGARLNHKNKDIGKEHYISLSFKKGLKPFLEGKNIDRYCYSQHGWLDYRPQEHYNSMFPELFENEKIIFINVVKEKLRFAYDDKGFYNSHTVINCIRYDKLVDVKYSSVVKALKENDTTLSKNYDYKLLLGILNSKLINWYFYNFLSESLHFYPNDAKSLPIKNISEQNAQICKEIITQANTIVELKIRQNNTHSDRDKQQFQSSIDHADIKIDDLVYKLYGLTKNEIRIIEGL